MTGGSCPASGFASKTEWLADAKVSLRRDLGRWIGMSGCLVAGDVPDAFAGDFPPTSEDTSFAAVLVSPLASGGCLAAVVIRDFCGAENGLGEDGLSDPSESDSDSPLDIEFEAGLSPGHDLDEVAPSVCGSDGKSP